MTFSDFRKIQRRAAIYSPIAAIFFALITCWHEGWQRNIVGAEIVILFGSVTLSITLFRRSKNLVASWGTARAEPDPYAPDVEWVNYFSLDFIWLLQAIFFIGFAAALPWFAHP